MIFLDNASATPTLDCAMRAFIVTPFGNPNSANAVGRKASDRLEEARVTMLRLLGAESGDTLIFTSGASEGAALAMKSLCDNCDVVYVNNTDHHCVTEYQRTLTGGKHRYKTGIARMLVQNEVGDILLPPDISGDSLWACDVTAAIGHIPFAFKDYENMSYAFGDAMKFGGIPGCGFFLAKDGAPISQMIYGAPIRGGTPPVALISAMAAALEWQCDHMRENLIHVSMALHPFMLQSLESLGVEFLLNSRLENGTANASPYIMNLSFPGVEGSALVLFLSRMGVMVSAGAACTTGDNAPSHVLMAMYGDEERARSAIRISFSHENTLEEVKLAAEKIAEAVRTLRGISAGATS